MHAAYTLFFGLLLEQGGASCARREAPLACVRRLAREFLPELGT